LTIHTTASTASLFPSSRRVRGAYLAFALVLGLAGIRVNSGSRKKKLALVTISAVLFGGLTILVACGGGSSMNTTTGSAGTAPGIYNVTVTGSSGPLQSQAQLTITVQ